MFEHSFWWWVLEGITNVMEAIAGLLPLHTPIGFVEFVQNFLSTSLSLLIVTVGSFIDLTWFSVIVIAWLILELVRGVLAIYRLIVRLIPLP